MISVIAVFVWAISSATVTGPPGVNLAALGHDGQSDVYRVPTGVVSPGDAVTVRFRTAADDVDTVTLRLTDQANGVQRLLSMRRVARAVSCYQAALARTRCDFWQAAVHAAAVGVLSYRFIVRQGEDIAYYPITLTARRSSARRVQDRVQMLRTTTGSMSSRHVSRPFLP